MEARTPEMLHPLWVQAHNMGDLDAMMTLGAPEVAFVTWSGHTVSGAAAVRNTYRAILDTKPRKELVSPREVDRGKAKTFGLAIPQYVLSPADQIIQ